jgi:hypothetical protein
MPDTAQTLINQALRALGELGAGETVPGDHADAALATLNDLLDGWTIERSLIYVMRQVTKTLVVSQATYTIGTSGTPDINTTRPHRIADAFVRASDGTDRRIGRITHEREEYNRVVDKTAEAEFADLLFYDRTVANGTIYLWPVPDTARVLHLTVETALGPLALGDTLTYPPGYKRALVHALAIELAPMFSLNVPPDVRVIAGEAIGALRAQYAPRWSIRNDAAGMGEAARGYAGYNIYTNYNN